MNSSRPSLWNGTTAHGIFGQKRLRHPWELRLLMLVTFATAGAFGLYGWVLTSPNVVCENNVQNLLPGSVFDYLPQGCDHARTAAEIFAVVFSVMLGIAVVIWIVRAYLYAQMRSRGVRMSPTQFPEGYRMVVEAAERFGLRKVPDAYVLLGNGKVNAFASGHGYRRFVVVYSDLFEIGGAAREPEALRFVINHEVGHLAAGHVSFFRLLLMSVGSRIPLLGQALSRAQEYTADNYGYDGAPTGASGTMGTLAAGKYLNAHVNVNAMADRAATEGGFWLHVVNWAATHPVLTWRSHALRDRSKPGRIMIKPPRKSAHYPMLAPSGKMRTKAWLSPREAALMLDDRRPEVNEEQFGRYPGKVYDVPADAVRLSNPCGVTLSSTDDLD